MGRSYTPAYRIEAECNVPGMSFFAWDVKIHGKPTDANAEKYRVSMNDSFQPGGVNEHIARGDQVVPHIIGIKIVAQKGAKAGQVVAEARMPMFEVV